MEGPLLRALGGMEIYTLYTTVYLSLTKSRSQEHEEGRRERQQLTHTQHETSHTKDRTRELDITFWI